MVKTEEDALAWETPDHRSQEIQHLLEVPSFHPGKSYPSGLRIHPEKNMLEQVTAFAVSQTCYELEEHCGFEACRSLVRINYYKLSFQIAAASPVKTLPPTIPKILF